MSLFLFINQIKGWDLFSRITFGNFFTYFVLAIVLLRFTFNDSFAKFKLLAMVLSIALSHNFTNFTFSFANEAFFYNYAKIFTSCNHFLCLDFSNLIIFSFWQ